LKQAKFYINSIPEKPNPWSRIKICSIEMTPLTRTGSHTEGATTKNDENYIIIKDKDISETFEKQFQKLWEKHK